MKTIVNIFVCTILFLTISCGKKSVCQTCTLDQSSTIRVEVCPDKATTYDGNTVVLESDLNGVPVSTYTATLKISGYKCE